MRELPVVTFMNKLDRNGLDPLDLIDEVSKTLNLRVAPINWPIGMGKEFKGVVDVRTRLFTLYSGGKHGQVTLETQKVSAEGAAEILGDDTVARIQEELDLLEVAGDPWCHESFLRGELSPVFFGSAMTNFGVEPLLDFLAEFAAPPAPRTRRR